MGSIVIETATTVDWKPQLLSAPAENKILYSLSLSMTKKIFLPFTSYATIGLLEGGETLDQLIATLASGQVTYGSPVAWSGCLPTSPDIRIFALFQASILSAVKLSAYVLPYKVSPEGGIIVDP